MVSCERLARLIISATVSSLGSLAVHSSSSMGSAWLGDPGSSRETPVRGTGVELRGLFGDLGDLGDLGADCRSSAG